MSQIGVFAMFLFFVFALFMWGAYQIGRGVGSRLTYKNLTRTLARADKGDEWNQWRVKHVLLEDGHKYQNEVERQCRPRETTSK